MTLLWVCIGAAIGAPARYLTDRAIQSRHDSLFPWGTLVVNLVGSLILGLLVGVASHRGLSPVVVAGVGTGFCGALTTYSTFGYETVRLAEDGAHLLAFLNVGVSIFAGFAVAAVGYAFGRIM